MNKVMNNLKKLSNSIVIQSVNENVSPDYLDLKIIKTPVVKHFGGFFYVCTIDEQIDER